MITIKFLKESGYSNENLEQLVAEFLSDSQVFQNIVTQIIGNDVITNIEVDDNTDKGLLK